jgi:hypothetical protein
VSRAVLARRGRDGDRLGDTRDVLADPVWRRRVWGGRRGVLRDVRQGSSAGEYERPEPDSGRFCRRGDRGGTVAAGDDPNERLHPGNAAHRGGDIAEPVP